MPDGYCAYPRFSSDELTESFRAFHRAGYKLAAHANGDAAVDQVLGALETLKAEEEEPPRGPVIIHSEFTHEDQLDRMQALGAMPSFFNLHIFYWWRQWIQWARASPTAITPMRGALERKLIYSSHTDSPVVDLEPFRIAWSAVVRRRGHDDRSAGDVMGPEQRINLYAALWGITSGAARQWDLEDQTGSIRPGLRADLVVLDRDPFELEERPDELLKVKVLATLIDGLAGYTTLGQPLHGVPGLKQGKPILASALHARVSDTWAKEHGDEVPTQRAQEERPLGACGSAVQRSRDSWPLWSKLLLCTVLLLGALLAGCLGRRLVARKGRMAVATAEELQVSLQVPHEDA